MKVRIDSKRGPWSFPGRSRFLQRKSLGMRSLREPIFRPARTQERCHVKWVMPNWRDGTEDASFAVNEWDGMGRAKGETQGAFPVSGAQSIVRALLDS
jgi:hypothetical protein